MSAAALTVAAFLDMAGACAPGVASETLAAIARTESGFALFAIGVNGHSSRVLRPANLQDATATATRLIAAGQSIDLGLMQINSRNLDWLGLSVADAFDPCRSIAAAAHVLASFSVYNTGSPSRGFANGYVARVVRAHIVNEAASASSTAPSAAQARGCTAPSWDVWARCAKPALRQAPGRSEPDNEPEAPPPASVVLRGLALIGTPLE